MALQDKYINPFTDFIEAAEIARFTPDEKNRYEESLKYYRDLKNVVDTSFDEGKAEIALQMKLKGLETSLIAEVTGLSVEEIEYL
ncbi:MAG: Rpn family recombination-promoting nuclease/putative transposase [Saprospiraceae bacterium]|nr:Rpn family recombination-promoting nuclease/putative transposase [Saprospiraceae bacterium]